MTNSILMAINDSVSSRNALDYLLNLPICKGEVRITLLHVFRKPAASKDLMGPNYMKKEQVRYSQVLEKARQKLLSEGVAPENIIVRLVTTPYATVTEGIIDQYEKGDYSMVVIGRKRMSKAEEFVLGDVGVKLVRALNGVAILVVKC